MKAFRIGALQGLQAEHPPEFLPRVAKKNLPLSLELSVNFFATARTVVSDLPSVRHYRHASLPKGIEDSALERVLDAIDKDSPTGARDYAIAVLMMAYGIRGISAAELLLDDVDWQHSRIRIRAQKAERK